MEMCDRVKRLNIVDKPKELDVIPQTPTVTYSLCQSLSQWIVPAQITGEQET